MDIRHPEYSIGLRPTQARDVEAIFGIRQIDEVAENQVKLKPLDTPTNYIAFFVHEDPRGHLYHSWTILEVDRVIGHITASQLPGEVYPLGFNLHPDYWGHGIMAACVKALMDDLYTNYDARAIICDCFADNNRCRNMLIRLGFIAHRMDLLTRIYFWWITLSTRPIVRHRHLKQTMQDSQ